MKRGVDLNRHPEQAPWSKSPREDDSGRLEPFEIDRSRQRQTEEEVSAPKRTNTYSSYRVRMSKWFVNSLIVIFILLMVGLLWWGLIGAPPLKELLKELL